jgi:hypothetical protein
MLEDLASHVVPLAGYPMAHVFLGEDGQLPSPEHMDQIRPLDRQAANSLWKFQHDVRLTMFPPDSGKYFRSAEELVFGEGEEQRVKKWLYERGNPFDTTCVICFQPGCAFLLTWKMVIHYSKDLFFGHDTVVWDRSLNWALYYDHNDVFHFAKDRIYDGEAEQLKTLELLRSLKLA